MGRHVPGCDDLISTPSTKSWADGTFDWTFTYAIFVSAFRPTYSAGAFPLSIGIFGRSLLLKTSSLFVALKGGSFRPSAGIAWRSWPDKFARRAGEPLYTAASVPRLL